MKVDRQENIPGSYTESVCDRLKHNQRIRRRVPVWGQIHIERQLPYLFVYRKPESRPDRGTYKLIQGQASYLRASGNPTLKASLAQMVMEIARTIRDIFGACLLIEIWSKESPAAATGDEGLVRPGFRIFSPANRELVNTVEALENVLQKIRIQRHGGADVERVELQRISPPGLGTLFPLRKGGAESIFLIGLEIRPVYRDDESGDVYAQALRNLHRQITKAFQKTVFRFARTQTKHQPPHYHALGRRVLVKSVWEVDRRLASIADRFDFLLLVTPVNSRQAWAAFKRSRFERQPRFIYRPIRISPGLMKRELFAIPMEKIEDPEVSEIFIDKQSEIDRQLTGLQDREKLSFLYSSMQIFGGVDNGLAKLAGEILKTIPPRSREISGRIQVGAKAFAARAVDEIRYFRERYPETDSKVQIRDDLTALMVSKGNLLVPSGLSIPESRLEALIQHEVGTHVLTYINGKAQPFQQLYSGLAGYDELQEGIAVLAEHLVGGLSRPRLRLLAARVIAVSHMLAGASFVETFRELNRTYAFSHHNSFMITMRVYRGGGLTKDASYLRGLVQLIHYLQKGGDLIPLLVGKISANHVPVVNELLKRKLLREPPLQPRYLDNPAAQKRLAKISQDGTVLNLIERKGRR